MHQNEFRKATKQSYRLSQQYFSSSPISSPPRTAPSRSAAPPVARSFLSDVVEMEEAPMSIEHTKIGIRAALQASIMQLKIPPLYLLLSELADDVTRTTCMCRLLASKMACGSRHRSSASEALQTRRPLY